MTQVDDSSRGVMEATRVPDLVAEARAELEVAEARAAQVGERRALLAARLVTAPMGGRVDKPPCHPSASSA